MWNYIECNTKNEEAIANVCDRLNSKYNENGVHFTWDEVNSVHYIIIDEILVGDVWVILYE